MKFRQAKSRRELNYCRLPPLPNSPALACCKDKRLLLIPAAAACHWP